MLRVLKLLNSKQKKTFFLLLILITVASILEMTSLAIIVPIINSFLEIENTTKELNLFWFKNFINFSDISISSFLLIFLLFFVFKTVFSIFVSWKHQNFIFHFVEKISFDLYSKYLSQDYRKYSQKNSSELIRNILKEIDLFSIYLQSFIQIILEGIILFGIFLFLFYLLTIPSIIVIFFSALVSIIYYLLVKKNLLRWGKDRQNIEKDRITYMQEGFSSIKEINFFNRNIFFLDRFMAKNKRFYNININFYFLNSIPRFVFELFTIILISMIFVYLIFSNYPNDDIIKVIALFLAASFRIIPSTYRIFNSIQNLKYSSASFDVLYDDYINLQIREKKAENSQFNFNKKINLKIKQFNYSNDQKFKLQDIDLNITKNQKVGIIGKSGSGKSTLIDILSGILQGNEVQLKIDDKLIKSASERHELQSKIGLIPQNISILDDTLRENVLFGLSKEKYSDKEIINILEISNLTNLLSNLPEGLNHKIKERGINFSGGEIQRIGIARALIFSPEILIFDEATSALDTFTENEILKDINSLNNKTIIMISHRMNTLKHCDKIYLIDNGKIIDEGDFDKFNEKY